MLRSVKVDRIVAIRSEACFSYSKNIRRVLLDDGVELLAEMSEQECRALEEAAGLTRIQDEEMS